jgi:predicted TPR repeat methyltransferase
MRRKYLMPRRYVSRFAFLVDCCRNKSVLHLGCSSGKFILDKIKTNTSLHIHLARVANGLYGVDIDETSLRIMKDYYRLQHLYQGNVEHLDELSIDRQFDIVLAGDILEHLSNPGKMLDGIQRFMHADSVLIISTNNAFSLPAFLRFTAGKYKEHEDHVFVFSPYVLQNLLWRHGYESIEIYGAHTRPPVTPSEKVVYTIGTPFLKMRPDYAGTLILLAKSEQLCSSK